MDEKPLDPARVYLMKHTTRTVSAEVDHGMLLNQIASVTISTARPLIFDRYTDNRSTGSFILIDPATNFTAGAGMISEAVRDRANSIARPSAAERLARLARGAGSEAEAIEAVRQALEDLLT
jgi:sulfate adenylyltransferase subunit 1